MSDRPRITVSVQTYVPFETKKDLQLLANKHNMSIADLLRELIRQVLEQNSSNQPK